MPRMTIYYRDDLGASPVILDTDLATLSLIQEAEMLHGMKNLPALTKAIEIENRVRKSQVLNDPGKVKSAIFEYRSVTSEAVERVSEKTREYSAGQRLAINELDMAYHLLNPQLIEGWSGKMTPELLHALKQECLLTIRSVQPERFH